MPRKKLDYQIETIKEELAEMTKLADEQLKNAMISLDTMDGALAREVLQKDKPVNELYIEVKERCIQTIALQQPVARDLRFISLSMDVAANIERIGDYALDIAKNVDYVLMEPPEVSGKFRGYVEDLLKNKGGQNLIQNMGANAIEMVKIATEIYIHDDEKQIKDLMKLEDEVDSMFGEVFKRLNAAPRKDVKEITFALNLILIARHLERIADHALNIANRSSYARRYKGDFI
jgi:phosphate transport system protein